MTAADKNADHEDEWSSICVIDLGSTSPRMAGWRSDNFLYPASSYKMYVLGEAIRQVCVGELSLDSPTTISAKNAVDTTPTADTVISFGEVLRLMCMYSSNTAANVAIDTVDRRRATALLHALNCRGSDVTRKFLPRTVEEAEFTSAPSTVTCALHQATFLWNVENGVIGGGRGRGLIKGYLATNVQNYDRFRKGLPASATICSKTGEWSNFTAEAALIEDGRTRYIACVMTALPRRAAAPRMAKFIGELHTLLKTDGPK
jgi:beta-lactamase class A